MLGSTATVDAVVHQRMAGVQHLFDGNLAMTALAIGDIVPRE